MLTKTDCDSFKKPRGIIFLVVNFTMRIILRLKVQLLVLSPKQSVKTIPVLFAGVKWEGPAKRRSPVCSGASSASISCGCFPCGCDIWLRGRASLCGSAARKLRRPRWSRRSNPATGSGSGNAGHRPKTTKQNASQPPKWSWSLDKQGKPPQTRLRSRIDKPFLDGLSWPIILPLMTYRDIQHGL